MRPWTWRTDTAECRAGEFEPDKRKRQTAPAASIASLTQRLEGAARAAAFTLGDLTFSACRCYKELLRA